MVQHVIGSLNLKQFILLGSGMRSEKLEGNYTINVKFFVHTSGMFGLMVVLEEMSESHQYHQKISSRYFMVIWSGVVEIFVFQY